MTNSEILPPQPSKKSENSPKASDQSYILKREVEHDRHSRKTPAAHGEKLPRMAAKASGTKKETCGKGNWGDELTAQQQGEEDAQFELAEAEK